MKSTRYYTFLRRTVMRKTILLVSVLGFSLCMMTEQAIATLMTFNYAGVMDDQVATGLPELANGQAFSGTITFDPEQLVIPPRPPAGNVSVSVMLTDASWTFNSGTVSLSAAIPQADLINNNSGDDFVDFQPDPPGTIGTEVLDFTGFLFTKQGLLPDSGGALSPFPSFSQFDEVGIRFVWDIEVTESKRRGVVTSFAPVPEPTTMLLLGTGLVGLVGFRKKFKK